MNFKESEKEEEESDNMSVDNLVQKIYSITSVKDMQFEDIIKRLNQKGWDLNSLNTDGMNILHEATRHGRIDLIEFLISNGALINYKNKSDETSLHIASREGNPEVIMKLLELGADIEARNSYAETT